MKYSLPAALALLGLGACQSSPSSTQTAQATKAATAPTAPAVASSPGTAYQEYRGLLPGQTDSTTLHLVVMQLDSAKRPDLNGSYYAPDGHLHELSSASTPAADSLVLDDSSPEQKLSSDEDYQPTYWRLRRQPGGHLVGTLNGQPVQLRRVQPTAGELTFAVRYFADSVAAFPNDPKSPKGQLSLRALVPVGGSAEVRRQLEADILRDLHNDTLDSAPTLALPKLWQQQRQAFRKDYRESLADMGPAPADTADLPMYRNSLRTEEYTSMYVLGRQGNLLSLAFTVYEYGGGAHGMFGTEGVSYDLRTGRRLRYDDIFLPTAAAKLPALLERAVRSLMRIKPGEPLDEQLLVAKMPVTHNVILTPSGVVFTYQPYEIAAYALGEVRVFLPLGQIRPLLREGLPLPAAPSLAAH